MECLLYTFHFRDVMVVTLANDITYDVLLREVSELCKFNDKQPFTLKWVDEEGKFLSRENEVFEYHSLHEFCKPVFATKSKILPL